jgi:hypothetical protein
MESYDVLRKRLGSFVQENVNPHPFSLRRKIVEGVALDAMKENCVWMVNVSVRMRNSFAKMSARRQISFVRIRNIVEAATFGVSRPALTLSVLT